MLGTIGVPTPCADSAWYSLTHPLECWSFKNAIGVDSISSTVVNTPPSAPQTVGAMTVPGVWTPDYAMQRTYNEVAINNEMITAAANPGDSVFGNEDPCSATLYSIMNPTECGSNFLNNVLLTAGLIVGAILIVR